MHIEPFQRKPMLLCTYCSMCADLSQETCVTYSPEEQQGCCQACQTLRNENGRKMFAVTECYSASLCQAGQSGNNSECTPMERSALPDMLTQLEWSFVSGIPKPYPWHHPGGTAKISTCLFSVTHFKIIPRVLQNFPSQPKEDPRFQLFWLLWCNFRVMMLKNRLLLTSKSTHRATGSGGHE